MPTTPAAASRAPAAYYPALDGLRAVAVILVFFQHYGAGRAFPFSWGWTGVDIFFVLSGFLITGILYDSQHQLRRYRDFYLRRTLRNFPLYYFVWGAILLAPPSRGGSGTGAGDCGRPTWATTRGGGFSQKQVQRLVDRAAEAGRAPR